MSFIRNFILFLGIIRITYKLLLLNFVVFAGNASSAEIIDTMLTLGNMSITFDATFNTHLGLFCLRSNNMGIVMGQFGLWNEQIVDVLVMIADIPESVGRVPISLSNFFTSSEIGSHLSIAEKTGLRDFVANNLVIAGEAANGNFESHFNHEILVEAADNTRRLRIVNN